MEKQRLLIVDGMALLFRSFFATSVFNQFFYNERGIPTNAVSGLVKHLEAAIRHFQPSHISICWDTPSRTFRHDLYEEYKGNRSAPPEEMVPQFDLAQSVTDQLGFYNIKVEGYEADDCIGALASMYRGQSEVHSVTGDKDLLQLLHDGVEVHLLQKGVGSYDRWTKVRFEDEMGLSPEQWAEVKAFMGDPSDGYPGVKGIGEKTAIKIVATYGSIQAVLDNIEQLTPSWRKKIEADQKQLLLSFQLAKINCDVPLTCSLDELNWQFNHEQWRKTLMDHDIRGLRALLAQIEKEEYAG
ncbi:5'-3' exonuclease [Bacillus litorisediminis]|uniref:5'-3' exonuclease n=1 Tax=Bacillus litorisediminis TaxID=2922713 RepID=UPI001FADF2CE|nr:5'-3' exonuclease [Bacillus litorisediminis]